MKKHTEKQPIDDLFARKLSNMSLPPSPDGFERLQARMGQDKPKERMVFWRNPAMHRYMAAAACLFLVCLFGWLYWPLVGTNTTPEGSQVAANQPLPVRPQSSIGKQSNALAGKYTPQATIASNQELNQEKSARAEETLVNIEGKNRSTVEPTKVSKATRQPAIPTGTEPAALAQTKAIETKANGEAVSLNNVTPANQPGTEQMIDNKTPVKPALTAERVLVVTIAEPASLVVARQAADAAAEEKPVAAVIDNSERETKGSSLWRQVKRIKQGELFARRDNSSDYERGLLDRAYNGLKHSLEKDKSAKQ